MKLIINFDFFFSVFCKNGHLCSFDCGLIEKDVEVYFSGYLKPIHSDDASIEGGVPGKRFGPIASWWMTGFDVGENPTIGFTTELGDYICMEPSAEYAPFMKSRMTKIYICKIVIEFLIYEPDATYEDLLTKLQVSQTVRIPWKKKILLYFLSITDYKYNEFQFVDHFSAKRLIERFQRGYFAALRAFHM